MSSVKVFSSVELWPNYTYNLSNLITNLLIVSFKISNCIITNRLSISMEKQNREFKYLNIFLCNNNIILYIFTLYKFLSIYSILILNLKIINNLCNNNKILLFISIINNVSVSFAINFFF